MNLLTAWRIFTSAEDLINVEVKDSDGNSLNITWVPFSYFENIEKDALIKEDPDTSEVIENSEFQILTNPRGLLRQVTW